MKVLGIETSCDETGIAIYDSREGLLGDKLYSQVKTHAAFGGVVPELASRDHIRKTLPLIMTLLEETGISLSDLDGNHAKSEEITSRTLLEGSGPSETTRNTKQRQKHNF